MVRTRTVRSQSDEDRINDIELGNEKNSTVIGILDMDAFEVQIYLQDRFGLKEGRKNYEKLPCILADSTSDRIISLNSIAKGYDISRDTDDLQTAIQKCDHLVIMRKDKTPGSDKPEGSKLRHASWAVLDSIIDFRKKYKLKNVVLEYASNDEFYLDLTDEVSYRLDHKSKYPITLGNLGKNTHLESTTHKHKGKAIVYRSEVVHNLDPPKYWRESRLVHGAVILEAIRLHIFSRTNFEASGGVSCNKLLAKLACPLHKPGGMTILPETGLERVGKRIKIENIPTLGGGRGKVLKDRFKGGRGMSMTELAAIPVFKIKSITGFGNELGLQVWKLANGISTDKVVEKLMKESVTVGRSNLRSAKMFFNNEAGIRGVVSDLLEELLERLLEEKHRHKRIAKGIRFGFHCFAKGHNKGRIPDERGFTLYLEDLSLPEQFNFREALNETMNEFRKMINEKYKGVNGMIVKINLGVKSFIDN